MGRIEGRRVQATAGWLLAACMAGQVSAATDYSVAGSVAFNGNTSALDDGLFLGASYAMATGVIGAGAFKFQGATVGDGVTELTYQLDQDVASAGQVGADGFAALADAALRLTVVDMTYNGSPRVVGADCVFQPIHIALDGSGSVGGLELAASGFVIAPVDGNACNGFAGTINTLLAGNANSMTLRIAGNFAPPGTIFAAGFESTR